MAIISAIVDTKINEEGKSKDRKSDPKLIQKSNEYASTITK